MIVDMRRTHDKALLTLGENTLDEDESEEAKILEAQSPKENYNR
jgi:hypothetical protein